MADAFLIETSGVDRYLLEDGSGVYLLDGGSNDSDSYVGGGYFGLMVGVSDWLRRWWERPVPAWAGFAEE